MKHFTKYAVTAMIALQSVNVAIAADAEKEILPPGLTLPKIAAPTIDGKFDQTEWEKAFAGKMSVNNHTGAKAANETRFYAGYDDDNLYVAFICPDDEMDKLALEVFPEGRDTLAWRNECVELFLTPGEKSSYYTHFTVDALGQKYDAWGSDPVGYNPVWQRAVSRDDKQWIAEMAIPLSVISDQKVTEGTQWRADFFRNNAHRREFPAWTPTFGAFEQIPRHGYVFFGTPQKAVEVAGNFIEQYRSEFKTPTPEMEAALTAAEELVKKSVLMPEKELTEQFASIKGSLDEFKQICTQQALLLKWASHDTPILLQSTDWMVNDAPTSTTADLFSGLKFSTLLDETNDFVWNLTNVSRKTVTVRMAVTSEADPDTQFTQIGLPGFNAQWNLLQPVATNDGTVVYDLVETKTAGVFTVQPGETIQPMLQLTPQAGVKLPSEVKGTFFVQIINDNKISTMKYPINVTVIDKALADAPPFYTFCWDTLGAETINDHPEVVEANVKMLADNGYTMGNIQVPRYVTMSRADKDGNLLDQVSLDTLDNYLDVAQKYFKDYYINIGLVGGGTFDDRFFTGVKYGEPGFEKAFKTYIKLILDHMQKRGIDLKNIYVNPYDESIDEVAQTLGRWILEINPEYQTILDSFDTNMVDAEKMDVYTTVWMPHYRTLTEDAAQPFHDFIRAKKDKARWLYYYTTGPNEKASSPYVNYTLKFWNSHYLGYDGLCYWAAGQYYGDPWFRKNFKGYDTALMYPHENGVMPSRRLFAWRRGMQDQGILKLAEQKLADNPEALKAFREELAKVVSSPNDPELATAFRDKCKEILAK